MHSTETGIRMNHINWIQQNEDYNVKYHVLKWKSSHFHEPYSSHVSSGAKISQGGAAASVPAAQTQAEGEGLGLLRLNGAEMRGCGSDSDWRSLLRGIYPAERTGVTA